MSELYKFKGAVFSKDVLLCLNGGFLSSYLKAVDQWAQQIALVFYTQDGIKTEYLYAQLHSDVKKIALLISNKTKPSDTVVIHGENSYEFVAFCLGTILAGRTLCPLSSRDTIQKTLNKIQILGDGCSVFSSDTMLTDSGASIGTLEIPDIATADCKLNNMAATPFIRVFTSGSTGSLKVAEQTESGVISNIDALIDLHRLNLGRTILTPLSLGHVNALEFALFCSLLSGQKLVLLENYDLKVMLNAIQAEQVDIVSVIPPILHNILQNRSLLDRFDLKSVRYFVSAATYLGHEMALEWLASVKIPLIQGYGLSEAINFSSLLPPTLTPEQLTFWLTHFDRPSIGPAVRGNDITILNENGLTAAEGEIGELCIRGWGVMLGYLNTKKNDIFERDYLHSGDLGFFRLCPWTGEKYYFITSRKKEIVKRYGLSISLREIESVAMSFLMDESDVIAVGFENDSAGEEIALFIRTDKKNNSLYIDNFSEQIKTIFSEDVLPRLIIFTSKNLRNISGKPNRLQFKELLRTYRNQTFGKTIQIVFSEQ